MGCYSVPVIDMQEVEGLAEKMVKPCEETGCFRVVNHGASSTLMSEMKNAVAAVFELPEEIKKGVGKPGTTKSYGEYKQPFESTGVYDFTMPGATDEYFDHLGINSHQRDKKWINALQDLAGKIGRKLMEGFGLAGDDLYDGWAATFRINKHNCSPETLGATGDDENVKGLEIIDEHSGEIISVNPVPGSVVVNCSDVAKAWSNGRFCDVKHQVKCYDPNVRYSMGVFVLAPKDAKVDAPPELIDSEHPRFYVSFNYEEYRDTRITKKMPTGAALEQFSPNKA